jgi:hypothetical protein
VSEESDNNSSEGETNRIDLVEYEEHVAKGRFLIYNPVYFFAEKFHAELKRCYALIDSLQNEMYGFKEALWAEALCDESENVVGVEAYPGDQKREKKVFFISCDLVDEMYVFFQQHGRLDFSKNASE